MNNNCSFCGNKNLTKKNVQYIYKHNSDFFIVNGVPCIACDFCGEQYFKGETLEKIESLYFEILQNKRQAHQKIEVPIEEYSNI